MKISCGVLIINEQNEILLGHVTGQKHFDIPKGILDENESYLDCAIRECQEETGFNLDKTRMIDCGLFDYLKDKKLYLFQYNVNKSEIDESKLVCNSFFEHFYTKKLTPEVDGFEWVNTNNIKEKCAKNMGNLLEKIFKEKDLNVNKKMKL